MTRPPQLLEISSGGRRATTCSALKQLAAVAETWRMGREQQGSDRIFLKSDCHCYTLLYIILYFTVYYCCLFCLGVVQWAIYG